MTTAIAFSRQNNAGSRWQPVLRNLVLEVVLVLESKSFQYVVLHNFGKNGVERRGSRALSSLSSSLSFLFLFSSPCFSACFFSPPAQEH